MEAFLVSTGIVALAEMGDKTQIATVMLAAQYHAWAWVVAGTTLGMMLAKCASGLVGRACHAAAADARGSHRFGAGFCRAGAAGAMGSRLMPVRVADAKQLAERPRGRRRISGMYRCGSDSAGDPPALCI